MRFKVLIPTILISASVLVGVFYVRPLLGEVQELKKKRALIEGTKNKIEEIKQIIGNLKSDVSSIPEDDIAKLYAMLPDDIDEPRYLDMIDAVIKSYGLQAKNLEVIDSGANENVPVPPVGDIGSEKGGASETLVSTPIAVDISFSVVATYDKFKDLLSGLEKSLVILDAVSVSLSRFDDGTQGTEAKKESQNVDDADELYTFEVKLKTYVKG